MFHLILRGGNRPAPEISVHLRGFRVGFSSDFDSARGCGISAGETATEGVYACKHLEMTAGEVLCAAGVSSC